MSRHRHEPPTHDPAAADPSRTAEEGTPVPVDVRRDLQARDTWLVLLAGPVIWFGHFMFVYLVAEAGCTGDGPGLSVFDPPVPTIVTLAATAVAALACVGFAVWAYRRWRIGRGPGATGGRARDIAGEDPGGKLAFAGYLLSLVSIFSVLIVGLPALVLPPC